MQKIKFNNTPNKCVTTIEGEQHWISRSVAVVGLVLVSVGKEMYVLCGKRGKGSADFQGYWNLPCGYIDWGENGVDACKREVYEETGLYLYDTDWEYYEQPVLVRTDPSNNRQNISLYYEFEKDKTEEEFEELIKQLNSNNSEEDEVEEIKFINVMDIDKYDFCFGHEKVIKNIAWKYGIYKHEWFNEK